jgi:hypothetical protein
MDDITQILSGGDSAALPQGAPADEHTLLVSRRVIQGAALLFVYRDESDGSDDSGWTLLAGTEPDAAMGDPAQFEERTVEWALDHAPKLASILAAPPDSSFERDSIDSPWVELVDE